MYYSYRTTDPYSSEYRSSQIYRPSREYRPSKEYRSSRDYERSGNRVYDCCAPPPPPKDDEYAFLPTYGSYFYDAHSRRAHDDCRCDCCPHTYQGARRVSEGRARRSSVYEREPSKDYQNSQGHRRSSVHEREPSDGPRGAEGRRRNSVHEYESPRDYGTHGSTTRSKRSSKPHEIEVRNHTNGGLFRDQKPRFYLQFDRKTTTRDVLNLLMSDSKRYQVIVHWDDQVEERLTSAHSWRDVRKYADYLKLEVKKTNKAKHVRWADQNF